MPAPTDSDWRIRSLLDRLSTVRDSQPLPADQIRTLIVGHATMFNRLGLPRLLVAALSDVAADLGDFLRAEQVSISPEPFGDAGIVLIDALRGTIAYEMKAGAVTREDVDYAVETAAVASALPDAYLFVTTSPIDPNVVYHAGQAYNRTGGMEVAILDVSAFVRHVLHFLHRHRTAFLDGYQSRMMAEPDSAVSLSVKEAFLSMRIAAENAAGDA